MNPEDLQRLRIRSEAKRRPTWMLWLIIVVVFGITVAALYLAWPRLEDKYRVVGKQPGAAVASTNAPAIPARNTNDNVVLTVSGYIVNRERIELSPRFLGVVRWIGVKKGDAVTNGQVVVRLDDAEQKARVSEAQARVATARTAVEKADLDYRRIRQLNDIESRQLADEMRLRLASTQAALREAEAQLDLARTYLDWTVIRSTIDGVVLEKLVDTGELVTPQSFGGNRGPSTAVLAVADPKDLQVEIELTESDLGKVRLNQQCRVSPEAYPEKSYAGYVAEMAPEANRQKGTLQIKVQVAEPDHFLTPELSAKVDFLR